MKEKYEARISNLENSKGDAEALNEKIDELQAELDKYESDYRKIKDLNR